MTHRLFARTALTCTLAIGLYVLAPVPASSQEAPASALTLVSSRVSIAGSSNIHAYTAVTSAMRLVRARLADATSPSNVWDEALKAGVLEAFEIAIPAATLSSPKEGIDKNMHRALKAAAHPDITFRLTRLENGSAAPRAVGLLSIAGVEREVAFDLKIQRADSTLTVKGDVPLVMTDFGVKPPTAMLGMLKTDPKVTVSFEVVLSVPLT